jgi:hypothetical protein
MLQALGQPDRADPDLGRALDQGAVARAERGVRDEERGERGDAECDPAEKLARSECCGSGETDRIAAIGCSAVEDADRATLEVHRPWYQDRAHDHQQQT